jgi:hypothetical protein
LAEPPWVYVSHGEKTSPIFCEAFAAGCGGEIARAKDIKDLGSVAMFGSANLWRIVDQAIEQGRTWYYGDKAYFNRHDYFRITKNAYQFTEFTNPVNSKRFDQTGFRIKPWQRGGKKILLCPQSDVFMQRFGSTQDQWVMWAKAELAKYTKRPVEVRYKTWSRAEEDFAAALSGAHAVVVFSSIAGVQAAVHGVPCFATIDCASARFGSMDLSLIESPVRPDNREQMAWQLAENQWTLDEIRSGMAWEHLNR